DRYAASTECRLRDEKAHRPLTHAVYTAYCDRCKVADAMDFDDLLVYTNVLLKDHPDVLEKYQNFFQYVLVDEYQDTNFAQHLIVQRLTDKHKKMCVVGDDAQSIYSFRGANISNILELKTFYPTLRTFKLEQNYRSTQNIINAANSLIAKNKKQIEKHIFSNNSIGSKVKMIQTQSDYAEAYTVAGLITSLKAQQGSSYEDFAILYRTNAQSRILEEALRQRNMPYRIYGGLSFYQRKEIKDAVSYFRLSINPDDDEALRRVINYPARGIGDTTVKKVNHCAMEHNVSMWQVINYPSHYNLNVNNGTIKKLNGFIELIQRFIMLNSAGNDAYTVAREIIERSQLVAVLLNDVTPENISRQENINELLSGVNEFVEERREEGNEEIMLRDYLSQVSLMTDQDEADNDGDCVTLMTVHAAKGLEYKHIIVVGVEEDLFPSYMSVDSLREIEEERRLLYVAITRAKENCCLTYCSTRFLNGETKACTVSRFIRDINPEYLNLSSTNVFDTKEAERHTTPTRRISATPPPRAIVNRPLQPSVGTKPAMPSSSGGSFTTHDINEVKMGTKVNHSHFGNGEVINIIAAENKILVEFENIGTKTLVLKYAKFEILS
ncbi:MAG: UvrD-helicase domain-containing protein, partial [Muribaculaceae bacterium]|nr:UvrD-helicase domain-containing protein [Muribaculaceae bacterium]